jgi:hypothetical protein
VVELAAGIIVATVFVACVCVSVSLECMWWWWLVGGVRVQLRAQTRAVCQSTHARVSTSPAAGKC